MTVYYVTVLKKSTDINLAELTSSECQEGNFVPSWCPSFYIV